MVFIIIQNILGGGVVSSFDVPHKSGQLFATVMEQQSESLSIEIHQFSESRQLPLFSKNKIDKSGGVFSFSILLMY